MMPTNANTPFPRVLGLPTPGKSLIDVVDFNPFAGLVKAQEYVAKQYQHVTTIIPPRHPIPAYPDNVFTYYTCGTSNPYLIVTVRDQQVPIVDPNARLNLSTRAFAINTWAEIAYQDPTVPKYTFRIAEDLIYDVNNDTFAVAAPFDVKGGRKQVSGISSVGPNSTATPGPDSSDGDSDTYNIKFTFLANPPAKEVPLKPTEGVTRIAGGQLGDSQTVKYGTEAFTELVARMYFNLVTAALGNECSPGYPELVPAAQLMQTRLKKMLPGSSSYHGLPLTETFIPDNNGSLCIQEHNTLYRGSNLLLLERMNASTTADCCHACRKYIGQDPDPSCNAWTFCLGSAGCMDGNATQQLQSVRTCSLFFDPGLLYNYPMDSKNGTLRGPEINFTSGRTAPVLPENIMSLLVPIEGTSDHQVDKIETFSRTTPSPVAAVLDYFRSALISFQT
ncbi:g7049 [Coccomyxa elongata]